ncbi:PorP/SprF family type IX secretion system membrane protein [Flagellimonas sp.]|uniref:PorP/SprF family type IX secretion system membrane protein n=1 Tax=Flagellimonas sp. TaxID=2058762 RepID=UPI003F4A1C29
MSRFAITIFFILCCWLTVGQERQVPADLRSHNLTQFNASLLDPTFSFDRNMPRSITVWSRWQWQTIDSDPTTLFVNYTQNLTRQATIGVGYLQHNTGVYLNRGALINFSYALDLGDETNLVLGTNIFAFSQEQADEQVGMNFINDLGSSSLDNSFVAQFSPGIRFNTNGFSVGLVVENAWEQNFSNSDMESAPRVFTGLVSNDFSISLFNEVNYLRPQAYVRILSDMDTQYGLNMLFANPKFWVQGGYNNFYGISGGAGVTLFEKLSLGGLVESGIEEPTSNEDLTFQIVASYSFGKQTFAKKQEKQPMDEGNEEEERLRIAKEEKRRRMVKEEEERLRIAEEEREKKRLEDAQKLAQARKDSIARMKQEAIAAKLEKDRLDSIAKAEREKEVTVEKGEKYEEVVSSDGLQSGFYLIANVFGTERYFLNFMKTLRTQGLEPKSFFRSSNGYNYVYLKRFNTIEEARSARNTKFNGSYSGALWIFRVKAK